MASLIAALRTYLASYGELKEGAPLWVNHLDGSPTQYAIYPSSGAKIVETYLNGGSLREFPFAFNAVESTADDLERMANVGFFEAFADWLEALSEAGELPNLGAKKTPTKIEALTWGFLMEAGSSSTGIYQVQCKLTYEQHP